MRLVLLNEKILGKELAMPIYFANGIIYANEGSILSEGAIRNLKNVGIDTVYIKDENNDMNLKEVLNAPIRLEVMHELKDTFDDIKKSKTVDEYKIGNIIDKIVDNFEVSENSFMLNNIGHKNEDLKLVNHSINVALLSLLIGVNKKYNRDKLEKLATGAILHDVGKLFDNGPNHCKIGYNIVKNTSHIPVTSYMCIFHHHESEDGTGYPEKLKGDKIHEFTKIVSICNEYNNLLQPGRFRLPSLAIEYIASQAGKKFDREIYNDFIKSIYCYPNGLFVRLNNGVKGVIVKQNKNFPSRPVVGVIVDGKPVIYDLLKNLTLFVEEVVL
jgi:HD-GYP domain-containing protein (c-di-GMP phosphodiesterase class II)